MKIIYFFFIILLVSCNNSEAELTEEIETSEVVNDGISVTTALVAPSVFTKQIISNGIVETNKKTELRFNYSEKIKTLNIRNGSYVKEGELIASLNSSSLKEQLLQAETALKKAENELYVLKVERGFGNTPDNQIPETILKTLRIRSGIEEATDAINNAKLEMTKTSLYAPFAGKIADLKAKQNDYISPGDVLCTLIGGSGKLISFQILENEYPFVSTGQTVESQLFNADKKFTGKVVEINPKVNENGLITLRASINNSTNLLDGMHLKVLINKPINNYIVVPKAALVLRSNREVVFTLENGLAKWNYVDLVDENSDSYALVKDKVTVGDTIIVTGNLNLSHDAKVSIENE